MEKNLSPSTSVISSVCCGVSDGMAEFWTRSFECFNYPNKNSNNSFSILEKNMLDSTTDPVPGHPSPIVNKLKCTVHTKTIFLNNFLECSL